MKKGSISVETLLHILANPTYSKQLLNPDDNCSFLDDSISKEECLNEFDRLLNSSVFLMKKNKNFHFMDVVMKILNQFYLERMKEEPFLFYEKTACINLLSLMEEYPKECEEFKAFLRQINFYTYQKDISSFYENQMKQNKVLNDFELKDFLNYIMIYKNHKLPHEYLRYIFYVLFAKKHDYKVNESIYAELFRFLILDLLEQLQWNGSVYIVSLKNEKKAFILQGSNIYINLTKIKSTLEENLIHFPYLFDLIERRYKYKSFAHNKYEEIKSRKQATIKGILGASFFFEHYSYLSLESEISGQSLIDRLRFFEDIAPDFYVQMIEDYEKQVIAAVKNSEKSEYSSHLILTLDDLLEQTVLLSPEVIRNQNYLQAEYHLDGSRKKIADLLENYEHELILARAGYTEYQKNADYYANVILTKSLNVSHLIEEFIALIQYEPKLPETDKLLEKIFCQYFVEEINDAVYNHILEPKNLDIILSKLNEYMIKFYERKQKEISNDLIKNPEKWRIKNEHLTALYHYVRYMSLPELYDRTCLNLTQVLELDEAKNIQKDVLQKKLRKQKVYMIVLAVLILIFSVSLFLLGRILYQYWDANQNYGNLQVKMNQAKPVKILIPEEGRTEFPMNDDIPQVDFTPLRKVNDEVIAWIRIDNTEINYPVLQGNNNEYYLSHLYNRKYNVSGSIFGDYRNGLEFNSDNLVLYGHNMKNGSMFGSLKKYKDKNYLEKNKYVWIITPKATYQYEIFATYEFNSVRDEYVFNFSSDESFQKYLNNITNKAFTKTTLEVTSDDDILTLSTCTDEVSIRRFVVVAKKMVTYVAIDN